MVYFDYSTLIQIYYNDLRPVRDDEYSLEIAMNKILSKINSKYIYRKNINLGYASRYIGNKLIYQIYAGDKKQKKIRERLEKEYDSLNFNIDENNETGLVT